MKTRARKQGKKTTTPKQQPDGAKSYCTCGHTGDGGLGEHDGLNGHGPCRVCDCRKFTWDRWTPYGEALAAAWRKARGSDL